MDKYAEWLDVRPTDETFRKELLKLSKATDLVCWCKLEKYPGDQLVDAMHNLLEEEAKT